MSTFVQGKVKKHLKLLIIAHNFTPPGLLYFRKNPDHMYAYPKNAHALVYPGIHEDSKVHNNVIDPRKIQCQVLWNICDIKHSVDAQRGSVALEILLLILQYLYRLFRQIHAAEMQRVLQTMMRRKGMVLNRNEAKSSFTGGSVNSAVPFR